MEFLNKDGLGLSAWLVTVPWDSVKFLAVLTNGYRVGAQWEAPSGREEAEGQILERALGLQGIQVRCIHAGGEDQATTCTFRRADPPAVRERGPTVVHASPLPLGAVPGVYVDAPSLFSFVETCLDKGLQSAQAMAKFSASQAEKETAAALRSEARAREIEARYLSAVWERQNDPPPAPAPATPREESNENISLDAVGKLVAQFGEAAPGLAAAFSMLKTQAPAAP